MFYIDQGHRDILPHGSYLVNLANPDEEKRMKAYECFLDELKRCEILGIQRHNFQYSPSPSFYGPAKFFVLLIIVLGVRAIRIWG